MKKRKIRRTMGVFFTTFLLLQIILLFLYKAFIVDIAKKNEENLVENTLQIYHNTMEGVLERLDDNLDLLLGYRLLLTQLNGENNLEKVKAQYKMLQILKERCKDTKEADAYAVVNCKDNSILIQRNGNITYDTIKDIKKYLQKRNTFDKTPTSGWTSTVMGAQVYLVKYYNYGANTIAVLISEKRLDSLLNYNDMSIKEAAFYLTDKKGEILCASGKDWAYGEEIENLQKQDPSISIYQGSVLEDAYQMYLENGDLPGTTIETPIPHCVKFSYRRNGNDINGHQISTYQSECLVIFQDVMGEKFAVKHDDDRRKMIEKAGLADAYLIAMDSSI